MTVSQFAGYKSSLSGLGAYENYVNCMSSSTQLKMSEVALHQYHQISNYKWCSSSTSGTVQRLLECVPKCTAILVAPGGSKP